LFFFENSLIEDLQKLNDLKNQGILTDKQFEEAKNKLIAKM
jgi:hypothetical protein